jgi:hypothetical protein
MPASPTPLWADNPTADDLLGFIDIAEPVIGALDQDNLDPVAIGIFGDWGSGKTTVLEIIQEALADRHEVVVVYTRPWEYDPATDPKAALIAEVLAAVRNAVADAEGKIDRLGAKVVSHFKRLAKRIKWSKAISLAAKTAGGLMLPSIDELMGVLGDAPEDAVPLEPTLQGFRDEFAELMGELEQIHRVVVLVDDLDRCLPPTVVATLEAIKLFLSVEKMGFVIAADRRLVAVSIAERYRPAAQAEAMALQYLEKIVQIPLSVPALGLGDTEAYLALLLVQRHLPDVAEALAGLIEHCNTQRRKSAPRVLDELEEDSLPDQTRVDFALAAQLAPVLYERTQGNPRRLKRFLNAFWLRSDIASRRGVELEPAALAKLLVLEEHEPEQFSALLDWLNHGELEKQLAVLENSEADVESPDPHATLRKWARDRPSLATMDLAPYLRLAASLASRTQVGAALRSDLQEIIERVLGETATTRNAAIGDAAALQTEDKLTVCRHLISIARSDPDRQDYIARALAKLVEDEPIAVDVATRLRELDASEVSAPLIVRLGGATSHPAMRDTIRTWSESKRLVVIAQAAAEGVLQSPPKAT